MSLRDRDLVTPLRVALLAAVVVASLGGAATNLSPWYYSLRKPAWQPPNWLFGPAWTLIYTAAAFSAAGAWKSTDDKAHHRTILTLFGINSGLGVLWSVLFFRFRRPDWALVEVGGLWASVLALIVKLSPMSRKSGWLLSPYILWVSFAAVLNSKIVRLNFPFRGHEVVHGPKFAFNRSSHEL